MKYLQRGFDESGVQLGVCLAHGCEPRIENWDGALQPRYYQKTVFPRLKRGSLLLDSSCSLGGCVGNVSVSPHPIKGVPEKIYTYLLSF